MRFYLVPCAHTNSAQKQWYTVCNPNARDHSSFAPVGRAKKRGPEKGSPAADRTAVLPAKYFRPRLRKLLVRFRSHISGSVARDEGVDEDVGPVGLLEEADAVAAHRLLPRGEEQRPQEVGMSGEDAYRREQPLVGQLPPCWCRSIVRFSEACLVW